MKPFYCLIVIKLSLNEESNPNSKTVHHVFIPLHDAVSSLRKNLQFKEYEKQVSFAASLDRKSTLIPFRYIEFFLPPHFLILV